MKKRLLILVGFLLYFVNIQAQEQSEHLLFVGAGAVDYKSTVKERNIQMQIGGALPYNLNINSSKDKNTELGFPYNILYIPPTFVVDKFQVSKGYFTESVKIEWKIGNNQDNITSTRIFRRKLGDTGAFEDIASVSKDVFEYNDSQVEGGVLFEYQVIAEGVAKFGNGLGKRTINYMEGIGFRNPTATVSGGITYEGGSPVQDVIVRAEPIGAENRAATSVYFPQSKSGGMAINNIENLPADKITIQAWVSATFGGSGLFRMPTNKRYWNHIYFGKTAYVDELVFTIFSNDGANETFKITGSYPTGEIDAEGKDVLKGIGNVSTWEFIHMSIIIEEGKDFRYFINGREINQAYVDANKHANIDFEDSNPNYQHNVLRNGGTIVDENYTSIITGNGNRHLHIDELRVWNRVLSNKEIRRDYRRY